MEFIDPIVSEFENDTGIAVEVVVAGTGELLTRIKTDTNSNCDVLWGGSLSTLESEKYLFEVYRSANEEHAIYKNMDGHITRFTMVPSVIMINTNLIGDIEIEGFKDLLNPELKGKIAFADPSKSSSSFEHLLNQLSSMGQGDIEKGWNYVERLIFNLDNTLLDGSSSVYNGVVQGQFTVGLTFEDPVAKFIENGAPVKNCLSKRGNYFQTRWCIYYKRCKQYGSSKAIRRLCNKQRSTIIFSCRVKQASHKKRCYAWQRAYSL